jgi:dephospho-CoA kinase
MVTGWHASNRIRLTACPLFPIINVGIPRCNIHLWRGAFMRIMVVVGMPASGKNIARAYAESRGMPYFATGDIVREEVKRRGLEANAANTGFVSTELRGTDGMGVTRKALSVALATGKESVFLEGMRSWPEIKLIRGATDCLVIAFVAPRGLRLERIVSRGRSDDSPEAFDERDMREIDYGTAVPIALADAYVLNTGSLEEALTRIDQIVTG